MRERICNLSIKTVTPTVFFVEENNELLHGVDIVITNQGEPIKADVEVNIGSRRRETSIDLLGRGENTHRIYVPDVNHPTSAEFNLIVEGTVQDRYRTEWKPQRRWQVHLIHYSHHDLGYTDLPSNVFTEYNGFYEDILRFCEETNDFPEEAKFRYTVEQSFSLIHFLENASEKLKGKFVEYMREGRIEVTALFGNQITEICDHEELIRLLYPAFELKHRYNIPIVSAMHNDIPGVAWGLATVLAGAGVKLFLAGIPRWYFKGVHPFWDESKVLTLDVPGAFIWEGPDGAKVIFWYDIHGDEIYLWNYEQILAELPERLQLLGKKGFPFRAVRYTVRGGVRDNAPPSIDLSYIVREWNDKWAYPKLVLSSNQMFLHQVEDQCNNLPVFRGELPNTDYTIGALSAAKETGINRVTHKRLNAAEKFATLASLVSDFAYPKELIDNGYKSTFYYDEHCFGTRHPVGPAKDGNWAEKAVFAYRGAALSHDILLKSLNKIVDEIKLEDDGYHIIVFNPLSWRRDDVVNAPLRVHSPCSFPMCLKQKPGQFYAKLAAGDVVGRDIVNLPINLMKEGFDLIDVDTGKEIPYQILKLDDPRAPAPYAADKYAFGWIDPSELYKIMFLAQDVPPMGYRSYRLIPSKKKAKFSTKINVGEEYLENRFFRILLDEETGAIKSIYDKELECEIVDADAPHQLNQIITRWAKDGRENYLESIKIQKGKDGPLCASLIISGNITGCPWVIQEITIYNNLKRIDITNRLLRDSTPLLEVYYAFPFLVHNPRFRFDGTNSVIEPLNDQLPGSNSDYYTMQHWVDVFSEEMGVVFSSVEAPIVELGGLWPGYVSGAHHGVTPPGYGHEFKKPGEFTKGYVYSYLMNNNFRTNFKNTQVSDSIFRYSITTHKGDWQEGLPHQFGWAFHNPLFPVYIEGKKEGNLSSSYSFCQVNQTNILLLTLKKAEDGKGIIARLIETQGKDTEAMVEFPFINIGKAYQTNLVEENERLLAIEKHTVRVSIKAYGVTTIRILTDWK